VDDSGCRDPREPVRLPLRPGGMRRAIRPAAAFAVLAAGLVLSACARAPGSSGAATNAAQAAGVALSQQARFRGIGPFDATAIGQAAWYKVAASGDGWEVLIRIGWGDCPAGCINEHQWTYLVGQNGSVGLTHEEGDALPGAGGVRGTVRAGPTCPVERIPPDPACADRPVVGAVMIVTDADGREVARVTSGADGTFVVDLAPGSYHLTAEPAAGLMGTPGPIDFVVEADQPSAVLQVSYDTGIR
jgi:hypothetical protein